MAHTPDPFHFCVTCGQPIGSEELAAEMLAALKTVLAGIRGKVIKDAVLIDLSTMGESAQLRPLSEFIAAVIAKAEGTTP